MNVLVIAPHPDDETLGCGGTLLKHIAAGDSVSWAIVTKAYEPRWPADVIERREQQIEQVSTAYGFAKRFRLTFPAARLDAIPLEDLMTAFREIVDEVRPDWIYTVHGGDIHSDHRVVFEATMSAVKSFNSASQGVSRLFSYETISSTDAAPPRPTTVFLPNVYCDITPYLERKLEIMSLYEGEVHPYPLPRALESIRALARFRGATIATEYAEAFMLLRELR
ncbi:MAG TPA: PIG-L family deacetylase [Pyrinomonadaceae bacterium]|jgi:LmbE family N-acetylglucosaminyl deacetylase|nr:PIG-L family deacetylase [Pyrinomonadaceae bacterium]